MAPHTSLVFKVERREPELIAPAKPTPHEFKPLSDLDDQELLRFQLSVIQFYKNNPSMQGKDPVKVVREALAKALVFYYPFAGRLLEGPNRKLIVECTGEGILFIEGDADVTFDQFSDYLQPPFPCFEELLFDVPGSSGIINCPLLLIQVTRLKCGGFIFALRFNHTMTDAQGLFQFLSAVAEMARGSHLRSILPVWERHHLNALDPPRVTCTHHEYDEVTDVKNTITPPNDTIFRSFFFGPKQISALRRLAPPHLANSATTFELLTACLWKCRTIAIQPDPDEEMRMMCIVNARNKLSSLVPIGYYGNAFVFPAAVATAAEISRNPLGYALELLKKVKQNVTEDYVRSVASLMVIKGRPHVTVVRSYMVSDTRHVKFGDVDYGWGKAVYGGVAKANPGLTSYYVAFTNKKGENGTVVLLCLPPIAMERFEKELDNMLMDHQPVAGHTKSKFIKSAY